MKKQIIVLSCVAAVAIATFVGKKAYEFSYGESKTLFKQNIEALTQGEVANGYVRKINPIYTKTCYRNYVDPNKYITKQGYDETTKTYYTYNAYYHSYRTYKVSQCDLYPVDRAVFWWKDCDAPRVAKCDAGDTDIKPTPYEYWE